MIPKSGYRFSEKIMLKQKAEAKDDSTFRFEAQPTLVSRQFPQSASKARYYLKPSGISAPQPRSLLQVKLPPEP